MRPEEFQTFYLQATAWMGGVEPSWDRVLGLYVREWAELFPSAQPTLLPPAELPPEIPRFSIRSPASGWRMAVTSTRIDIVWESVDGGLEPSVFADRATGMLTRFFSEAHESTPVRLALVVRRLKPDEAPGVALASYFCRRELRSGAGPLNRPQDFEIHAHKVYQPQTAPFPRVNSWVRWKTARRTSDDAQCILLEQDLNTLAAETAPSQLNSTVLPSYFRHALAEVDDILALYLSEALEEQ